MLSFCGDAFALDCVGKYVPFSDVATATLERLLRKALIRYDDKQLAGVIDGFTQLEGARQRDFEGIFRLPSVSGLLDHSRDRRDGPRVLLAFPLAAASILRQLTKSYCEGALVSITGASGVPVTANGCKFVFRIRGNDNIQAKAIVAYALQNLKAKKIGLISINDDFGKGGANRVLAELKSNGIEPASVESHNAHDTDFSAQLARLQRAGAELVVLWTHDSESALIVRQARQLGLNMKFAGSSSLSQPEFIQLAGPTGEGVVSASDFVSSNPDPRVRAFVKKYKAKYKDDPELYAATYYDSIKLAAQAINAAGSTDPEKVRDAFSKIEATGVLAAYKCDQIGDCNHQTLIVEIKNGQPSVLSTVKF